MSDGFLDILPAEKGVTLYVGIGNSLRADDHAGVYITERLDVTDKIKTVNAGEKPELGYDEAIDIKPAKVVFIDAADMGLEAGSFRILYEDTISVRSMSTHKMPVPLISKLIREETGAEVVICGIQPMTVEHMKEMTEPVKDMCNTIISIINNS